MAGLPPSCDTCRKRKVKCDRLKPCSNCRRHNTTCHTRAEHAPPRGRQGGRRAKEAVEFQARLARLEALVESLSAEAQVLHMPTPDTLADQDVTTDSRNEFLGDKMHRYAAGPVWSQLAAQVRQAWSRR